MIFPDYKILFWKYSIPTNHNQEITREDNDDGQVDLAPPVTSPDLFNFTETPETP